MKKCNKFIDDNSLVYLILIILILYINEFLFIYSAKKENSCRHINKQVNVVLIYIRLIHCGHIFEDLLSLNFH